MSASVSPKKLQRFIHNQLLSPPSNSQLSFSRSNLLPTHRVLPAIIAQCHLHSLLITSLDCHFCLINQVSVCTLCQCLVNLRELKIIDCQLQQLHQNTAWPRRLRCIDFSRNQLTECPQGLTSLLYITTLNLSGNYIHQLDPLLLKLPLLEKLYFIQNPVQNVPKHLRIEGVQTLREYFNTDILPLPPPDSPSVSNSLPICRKSSNSVCDIEKYHDLRRYLLSQQGSFDSGYESSQRCRTTSGSSINTSDSDNTTESTQWPLLEQFHLPSGYSPVATCKTNLCQVFLPEGFDDKVHIELVKDLSLYPKVDSNELLITPVVEITPHGRKFNPAQPAIVVLPHCTKPEVGGCGSKQDLVPVYSGSGLHQSTAWGKLDGECDCEIFQDHIVFKTTHFSLFAVVSVLAYPSASISVGPDYGGSLIVSELPGFQVNLPPTSTEEITVTATVYYDDAPYNIETAERALASPCIGLEPHGAQFVNDPVQIILPIPNYVEIMQHYPTAKLELWHAPGPPPRGGVHAVASRPENWGPFENCNISIQERGGQHVLVFYTGHFSWWETLWDIGRRALQKVGLGASMFSSRTRYVSVRIQALMSPPMRLSSAVEGGMENTSTFGLLVAVYKFGTPLSPLSNYPLSLLDSGTKRIYLQLGPLEVSIQGCFSALDYEDPTNPLSRSTELIEFNGDDFCHRFEFALQLRPGCELQEGRLMGKLHFKQWNGSIPSNKNYNLIVQSGPIETSSTRQPLPLSPATPLTPSQPHPYPYNNPDFTPPWSPESDNHMESEEIFLGESSISLHNDVPKMPRKRPLNLMNTPSHQSFGSSHSVGAKRRLLCRQGDIDEKTLSLIAREVGSKYTELGIQLGLNYNWIQSNVENKPSMNRDNLKALHVLHEWRSRSGEEFTYSELARALEADEVGLRSVAVQICYTTS